MIFLSPGFGLARSTFGPGLFGLARPEKRPEGPCLGLWPGTQDCAGPARSARGPGRAVPFWAVPGTGPGRAGPGGPFAHLYIYHTVCLLALISRQPSQSEKKALDRQAWWQHQRAHAHRHGHMISCNLRGCVEKGESAPPSSWLQDMMRPITCSGAVGCSLRRHMSTRLAPQLNGCIASLYRIEYGRAAGSSCLLLPHPLSSFT